MRVRRQHSNGLTKNREVFLYVKGLHGDNIASKALSTNKHLQKKSPDLKHCSTRARPVVSGETL